MFGLRRRKYNRVGFALIEIIIAVTILGVAVVTLLRSFAQSVSATRKNEIRITSVNLAEKILQEFELKGRYTSDGTYSGNFGDDFADYSWELSIETEPVEYEDVDIDEEDLESLRPIVLEIFHDDRRLKAFTPLSVHTYLLGTEHFSQESKNNADLF